MVGDYLYMLMSVLNTIFLRTQTRKQLVLKLCLHACMLCNVCGLVRHKRCKQTDESQISLEVRGCGVLPMALHSVEIAALFSIMEQCYNSNSRQ